MDYSFHLSGTRPGPERELIDPYTAQPARFPSAVMSDDERRAVGALIAKLGGAFVSGGTVVLPGAQMTFVDVDGPMFGVTIRGAIEPAMLVLFEVATAGHLVVTNSHDACDEPVPVVTSREAEARAETVGTDDPEVATDADSFLRALLPGYGR